MKEQWNEVMFPEVRSSYYQVSQSVLWTSALRSNVFGNSAHIPILDFIMLIGILKSLFSPAVMMSVFI